MESLFLFIHTILPNQILIGLFNKKGLIDKIVYQSSDGHSKVVLNTLDKLLKQHKIKFKNLKGIAVVNGPGSFTGIRLGLAVANTLSYFLKIPAVDITLNEIKSLDNLIKIGVQKLSKEKKQYIVLPFYGKGPNITRSKK